MSILRIEHHTSYRYSQPVGFGRHRLVIRPREGHELRILKHTLEISPAYDATWSRDVFGNSVALIRFHEEADALDIRSEVIVERVAPFPSREPREPWKVVFPVSYEPIETTFTTAYMRSSYPDDVQAVRKWLQAEAPNPDKGDAEGVVLALGEVIHQRIKYRRRPEKGVQTPARTIELGSGSCRDMATLMMEAARLIGVASRFASGYLDCAASLAGRASMHAWTEYYLPLLGWRGFDPTLGEPISLKHVLTGVSDHPRGVMPVSGMFSGTAADLKSLTVTVLTERLPAGSAMAIGAEGNGLRGLESLPAEV